MALPSVDAFAGAAGAASNPPWTQSGVTAETLNYDGSGHGKASAINGGLEVFAFVNDNVFSADQFAQFTVVSGLAGGTNYFVGIVRGAKDGTTSSFQGYEINGDGVSGASNTEYVKWVNGASTVLGNFTFSPQFGSGDVVKWQMVGTTLTLFRNGTQVATATDSTFSRAGAPGVGFFNGTSNTVLVDDFTGDNVGAAVGPTYVPPVTLPLSQFLFQNRPPYPSVNVFKVPSYPGVAVTNQLYTQSVDGATDFVGTLSRQTGKALAGTVTSSGALTKQTNKSLTGTTGPSGVLQKQLARALQGALTFVGTLSAGKLSFASLSGALSFVGTLTKQTNKILAGALSFAGTLTKRTNKVLAGATGPTGTLAKSTQKPLAGSTGPSGTLTKQTNKPLTGAIGPSGTLTAFKVALKSLTGALSFVGTLAKQTNKVLVGATGPIGTLTKSTSKSLAGSIGPAGSLVRRISRALVGSINSSGTLASARLRLQSLAGSLGFTGIVTRQTSKSTQGSIAPSGAVTRRVSKPLGGQIGLSGQISRLLNRALGGSIFPVGTLTPAKIAREFLILLFGSVGARYIIGALSAIRYSLESKSGSRYGPSHTGEASDDIDSTSSAKDDLNG